MTLGASTPSGAPPGSKISDFPAIDRSVLGEWLAGDNAAIDELLAVFRDSVCAELVGMREMLAGGRLEEFASAAHRLRGAALSMGARALAEFVGLLFTAAQAGDATACGNGMPKLETHVDRVIAEIPPATKKDTP